MSRLHGDGLGQPVAGPTINVPVAYTPVVTWTGNTITTQSGFYMKLPGLLQVWVSFVETAGTVSAALTITIPTGYTAVTMAGSLNASVGRLFQPTGATAYDFVAAAGATTQISAAQATPTGIVATWTGSFIIPTLT